MQGVLGEVVGPLLLVDHCWPGGTHLADFVRCPGEGGGTRVHVKAPASGRPSHLVLAQG